MTCAHRICEPTTAMEVSNANETLLPAFNTGSVDDLCRSFEFVDFICKLSQSSTYVQSPMEE